MDIAELSHPEKDAHVWPMEGQGKKTAAGGLTQLPGSARRGAAPGKGEVVLSSRMWGRGTLGRGALLHG